MSEGSEGTVTAQTGITGGIFAPLRVADFRRLWIGQTVSVMGDALNALAMAFMVFKITGSALHMGVMLAATVLPSALFGLFAGALADRWDRRRTMIIADIARAALVVSVPFVLQWGVYPAYVIAFLVATASIFFEPAKLSLLPELVDDKLLLPANSLDSMSMSSAELVGLGVAAAVVAGIGYQGAFYLDGASYLFSAVMIATIAHRSAHARSAGRGAASVLVDVREGLGYIWTRSTLRNMILLSGVSLMAMAATITIFYQVALGRYHTGAPGLALMEGAMTLGALIGAATVGRTGPGRNGLKVIAGLIAFAVLWSALVLAPNAIVAGLLLFGAGVANGWFYVPGMTIIQCHAEDTLRGRVMGARAVVVRTMNVLGLVLAGAGVQAYGLDPMILTVGIVVLVAGLTAATVPSIAKA